MQRKGKVSTIYFKSFSQIRVHFQLKDQANYIRYNSSNILLYLIGATKAKNMWRSNAAKDGKNVNGTLR